jgi:hypothetical protein
MLNVSILSSLANLTVPIDTADPFAAAMLPAVLIIGFVAAAGIGTLAWYNSKRPPGWENKERPDVVPKVNTSGNPES